MVRRAAARRPDTPSEVLEGLVRAHGDVLHIRPLLVDPQTSPVTCCARSSTNRARTCATSPCETRNRPSRTGGSAGAVGLGGGGMRHRG
ncbi:hypothetical protein ACFYNF_25485 [Streptomyces sp. NPDC006641]|uniref:hypothetical protein n=1 Tax=unclassified Streptomyces TaxID=2593676 RepID=UPI00368665BC